jgi:hypothetical protein
MEPGEAEGTPASYQPAYMDQAAGVPEPDLMAEVAPAFRAALRRMLGQCQLLRLEGDLNETQATRVDDAIAAATQVLATVQAAPDPATPPLAAASALRLYQPPPQPQPAPTTLQFHLKLTAIGPANHRRLVDKQRTCQPQRTDLQYEFHWLVFAAAAPNNVPTYSANCDLWRWADGSWRSIAVPGARFTPDELYDHGWRYCGPCLDPRAVVEVSW